MRMKSFICNLRVLRARSPIRMVLLVVGFLSAAVRPVFAGNEKVSGRITAIGSSDTGLIFKLDSGLSANCQGSPGDWIYAPSYMRNNLGQVSKSDLPMILLLADALRERVDVYTTSTARDQDGNVTGYCSADLVVKHRQLNWTRYAENPILLPGLPMGTSGRVSVNAADPSVIYDSAAKIWKMWFANAFDQNNSFATLPNPRVGLSYATSSDGLKWQVDSYGVLLPTSVTGGTSADWDFTNVETPSVIQNPDRDAPVSRRYMMWYAGGNKFAGTLAASGHPYYQIGLAFSADGKNFTRLSASESPYGLPGLVLRSVDTVPAYPKPAKGVAADPDVVYRDGKFHMWFSNITYSNSQEKLQTAGISYATSVDGINWTPAASNPLTSLWRGNTAVGWQPSVLWSEENQSYEMWFTADTNAEKESLGCSNAGAVGFFRATSKDGVSWKPNYSQRDFEGDRTRLEEACNLITGVEVVEKDGEQYMYYSSYGTKNFPPLLSAAGYPWVWSLSVSTRSSRRDVGRLVEILLRSR